MPRTPRTEFEMIAEISDVLSNHSSRVIKGIGDDAAVLKPTQHQMLFSSDATVENIHFKRDRLSAHDLAHKSICSALSDMAAMNGLPLYVVISLALPDDLPDRFIRDFYLTAKSLELKYDFSIVGGDTSKSPGPIMIDVAVIGESRHPIYRSGAKLNDFLAVSGSLGKSAAGLKCLEFRESHSEKALMALKIDHEILIQAHHQPEPRFDLVKLLSKTQAQTSMIDISDGLSSEIHHLANSSDCGFEVIENQIPIDPITRRAAQELSARGVPKASSYDLAWDGGEDYQLLMTLNPLEWQKAITTFPELEALITIIGKAVPANNGITLLRLDGKSEQLEPKGWRHF